MVDTPGGVDGRGKTECSFSETYKYRVNGGEPRHLDLYITEPYLGFT